MGWVEEDSWVETWAQRVEYNWDLGTESKSEYAPEMNGFRIGVKQTDEFTVIEKEMTWGRPVGVKGTEE